MKRIHPTFSLYYPTRLAGTALLALWAASGGVLAEELPTINVTATRTARTADETLASVTVITRQQIETSQAKSASELMDGIAGISFHGNGGYGKVSSLSLRGSNSNQVLVLVDGVRVGSASLGSTAWQYLPISQIERIEIVRGPRSHLYGSEAMGGVIQIFTRDGEKGMHMNARAGYGTYNTFDGSVGISGGNDDTRYSLNVGYLNTDNYNAREGNDPDDDGYDNLSLSASLNQHFSDTLKLRVSAVQATGNTQYDGFDPTRGYDEDFLQRTLTAALDYSPMDWWDMKFSLGQSWDEGTQFVAGIKGDVFKTKRPQVSWQNDFMITEESLLTAGIDFIQDQVDGTVQYAEDRRNNTGVFVQYQTEFGAHSLSGGLRYDDNEAYGGNTTGDIAWGYGFNDHLRLVASYGTAFRAPTFNDLYYPFGGNPDLDPERSKSGELGLDGSQIWGGWSLRVYRTDIDDLIQWAPAGGFIWRPQNIASARIDGLELSANTRLAGWVLSGSLTLLDAIDQNLDRRLPGRAKQNLRLDLDRQFGRFGIGGTLRARSDSVYYDFMGDKIPVAGYGLLDLRGNYVLSGDWSLLARIGNLFDKPYQTVPTYNQPGREFFLSLVYQPE